MRDAENIVASFGGLSGIRRAIVPITAFVLAIVFIIAAFENLVWLWGLLVCLIVLAVSAHDVFQERYAILRNYPGAGWARYFFRTLRPFLRSYIVEGGQEGRPFNQDQRNLVYERARNQEDDHPFGTELDVYSSEFRWITHSIAPVEPATEDPRVTIGGPDCKQPYDSSILNISAMSFGSLSARAIESLNAGARIGNFAHDTGEGSISPYHRKGGDLIWELGSGYFGCRDNRGNFDPERFKEGAQADQVKMIEIKLSQGAKPGHGGVLPGAKVTREIAETRKVPEGQDCVSPAAHSTFSTPREMLEFVARLREMSGGKPVGIKLCVGHPHEVFAVIKAMLASQIYVDFIVVDGAEGGTGAAPIELSNHVGLPLNDGLVVVRNALIGAGLKDRIRLGASGKVHSGSGIAHSIALGADWTNAARVFMFSLGCIQSMRCHTGTCPTGVATQDLGRQRGLVVKEKAQQVASAAGVKHIHDLEPHHLFHRVSPTAARTADQIYPFVLKTSLSTRRRKRPTHSGGTLPTPTPSPSPALSAKNIGGNLSECSAEQRPTHGHRTNPYSLRPDSIDHRSKKLYPQARLSPAGVKLLFPDQVIMTHRINFEVAGHGAVSIELRHGIVAGWTGRNADAVAHHIAELEEIGVKPPSSVPLYYRVAANLFSTGPLLETVGNTGSGEAEPVLIDNGERLFLGLGSDHTDRDLEAHSVALSKQVCGKPVAPTLWAFHEVEGHLDEIAIRSSVRESDHESWTPYQEGTLAGILPLPELISKAPTARGGARFEAGTAMMCGTFPVISGGVRPSRFFRMEMVDDRLGRRIEHVYETKPLPVVA
ncbi:glutamate synthase-related protein [Chelativorans sp. YIM 93263]|uniref:glutamate synthase-related protein n=1 Tax=Chelativorans sp. YIM 93263 TaxID=2906648 RepID=UPI002378CBD2|nr:glutamate synthase-related protein [Chelativorans sp. YIM 93263]